MPMKAGGAQFGSMSFTFFVRRILAPVALGAQLCATGAVTADADGHAQMTSAREQTIVRTMRSPLPPPPSRHRIGALGGIRTPDPQIRSLMSGFAVTSTWHATNPHFISIQGHLSRPVVDIARQPQTG